MWARAACSGSCKALSALAWGNFGSRGRQMTWRCTPGCDYTCLGAAAAAAAVGVVGVGGVW